MTWRTKAGSTVTVSGEHNGVYSFVFDWFEEGACLNAIFGLDADIADENDAWLRWDCECCEPGQARLTRVSSEDADT